MKHATNIIRVAAKWNPLGNFAVAGKQVPMGNNGPKFLINGYFVTDRMLHTPSVNLMENNGERKMRAGFCGR